MHRFFWVSGSGSRDFCTDFRERKSGAKSTNSRILGGPGMPSLTISRWGCPQNLGENSRILRGPGMAPPGMLNWISMFSVNGISPPCLDVYDYFQLLFGTALDLRFSMS